MTNTRWMDTAACRGLTDLMILPTSDPDGPSRTAAVETAQRICAACPHTGEHGPCVAYARRFPPEQTAHAVWGGIAGDRLAGTKRIDQIARIVHDIWPTTCQRIANMLGLSHSAVAAYLRQLSDRGEVEQHRLTHNTQTVWTPAGEQPSLAAFGSNTMTWVLAQLADGPVLQASMCGPDKHSRQTISQAVTGLERTGWVTRTRLDNNRAEIALTAKGERLVDNQRRYQ